MGPRLLKQAEFAPDIFQDRNERNGALSLIDANTDELGLRCGPRNFVIWTFRLLFAVSNKLLGVSA
jgi:hypothetical protein